MLKCEDCSTQGEHFSRYNTQLYDPRSYLPRANLSLLTAFISSCMFSDLPRNTCSISVFQSIFLCSDWRREMKQPSWLLLDLYCLLVLLTDASSFSTNLLAGTALLHRQIRSHSVMCSREAINWTTVERRSNGRTCSAVHYPLQYLLAWQRTETRFPVDLVMVFMFILKPLGLHDCIDLLDHLVTQINANLLQPLNRSNPLFWSCWFYDVEIITRLVVKKINDHSCHLKAVTSAARNKKVERSSNCVCKYIYIYIYTY